LAQDSLPKTTFAPSFNVYLGYLPKTYPVAPPSNYTSLFSLGLMWQFNGKDNWHHYYHYPKGGVELFYSNFHNPSELGYNVGFVPSLEINGKNLRKKWRAKFGLGIAYFNKPFNPVSNPNNYYIGSHITNMTTISFLREHALKKSLSFTYGATLIHCSNGHVELPNVGMNMVVLNAGIRLNKTIARNQVAISPQKNKLTYVLKFGLGVHQFGATEKAVGGPTYPSYHLSGWVSKPFKNNHLVQLGFTYAYYSSFYNYITSQEVDFKNKRLNSCTGIIFVGHEFVFGKFSLSTQAGLYVFNPFFVKQKKIEGRWHIASERLEALSTNRLGLLYYPLKKRNTLNNVKNQLMFGVFIKANLAQADLIEYSVGYVF
jgi:hypothetical protein